MHQDIQRYLLRAIHKADDGVRNMGSMITDYRTRPYLDDNTRAIIDTLAADASAYGAKLDDLSATIRAITPDDAPMDIPKIDRLPV